MKLYLFGDSRCVFGYVSELSAQYMQTVSTFVIVSERNGFSATVVGEKNT